MEYIKKVFRVLVNWIALLTMPIWFGTVVFFIFLKEDIIKGSEQNRSNWFDKLFKGNRFMWE